MQPLDANIFINMLNLQNDLQEFEETDFPAFPVVFQQEIQDQQLGGDSRQGGSRAKPPKAPFKMPENDIKQLLSLMDITHDTVYPEFFKQSFENNNSAHVQNFLDLYRPLNAEYIEGLKEMKDSLKLVRLSSNKLYFGQFLNQKCSGKSVIVFKNGNVYEGDMLENKREGEGVYVQLGVGWYQGTFNNDLKTDKGVEVIYRKWAYKGGFLNGLRNDKGVFVQGKDLAYYGQWRLGIMHGKGTIRTSQSLYNGFMVNSLKHGNGEERFTNGDCYKGEYQNNRFDGFGTYSWKEGNATYEGSFKNGLRHGKGKWSGGETKYSGSYVQGLKQGYGELYFPSGNFYKGNFVEDKREGYGQMFWTDGSFYKGDWKSGTQNGKGQLYIVGGDVISGLFENSILVQITPSIYEKQMEISSMGIQDLFGSNPKLTTTQKTRTFSESKGFRKKLAKIDEGNKKKASIRDNMYFKTPTNASNSRPQIQTHHHNNHMSHNHGHSPTAAHIHHTPSNRNSIWTNLSQGKSSDGRDCKCMRKLENFRLRQRLKSKMEESKVMNRSGEHSKDHSKEHLSHPHHGHHHHHQH